MDDKAHRSNVPFMGNGSWSWPMSYSYSDMSRVFPDTSTIDNGKVEKKTEPTDVVIKLYFSNVLCISYPEGYGLNIKGNQFIKCKNNIYDFLYKNVLIYESDDLNKKGSWLSVRVKKMDTKFANALKDVDLKEISTHDIVTSLYVADVDDPYRDGDTNVKIHVNERQELSEALKENRLSL